MTSEDAVEEMIRRTVLEYGGLDVLVASAGLATSASVTETTLDDWELSYAVLARGYFLAAREAFRVLIEQGRGGSIVFVGSKNALVAGANAAAYSSAKAAALHLGRCLAEEGGPHGIRVNTVNPDAVIQGSSIWSIRLEGRAREHVRRQRGRAADLLPGPDEARRRRPARGRRRGDRVLRRAAVRQIDRKCRQRRRRRDRRISPVVRRRRTVAPVRSPDSDAKGTIHAQAQVGGVRRGVRRRRRGRRGRAGRPEPLDGGQDVLLHPEGHAQPVRGDRRPRRQARARPSSATSRSSSRAPRTRPRRSSRRSRLRSRRMRRAS